MSLASRAFGFVFAVVLLVAPAVSRAEQAAGDSAAQTIQTFYGVLLDAMKGGKSLGAQGRYKRLQPAVEAAFDLPAMARLSVGPAWDKMSDADKQEIVAAFTRNTIANYAANFDSFDGQKFVVDPMVVDRSGDKLVKSQLVSPNDRPVAFNYRMRKNGESWKVIDIYLDGTISQLATRRSDFSATVAKGGAKALAESLNKVSDNLMK